MYDVGQIFERSYLHTIKSLSTSFILKVAFNELRKDFCSLLKNIAFIYLR